MDKSGARFSKLKLVYKKAMQEMLNINLDPTESADSFYNTTAPVVNQKEKLELLKSQLSDLFKQKIKEVDLEAKLNLLDTLILEDREVGDINDEKYIKEILESYLVEDKLSLMEFVNKHNEDGEKEIKDLEEELNNLEKQHEIIKKEFNENEERLNKLIEDMKEAY